MTAPKLTYEMIDTDERIDAIMVNGVDGGAGICGAYQPVGHDYWCLFITKTVTDLTGLAVPPRREQFGQGRQAARAWVELLAALVVLAMQP